MVSHHAMSLDAHMPRVHLIEGPVGAGKSTYSSTLALQTQGVHIALDEWFAALFSSDRPDGDFVPWYIQRKERLLALIWTHSRRVLASGKDVILELGLIQRQSRVAFGRQIQREGYDLLLHVLDAPLEVRRERVRRRNTEKGPTFAMVVSDHVFEAASKLWEAPDDFECSEFSINFLSAVQAGTSDD
jgi:predicted kinase